MPEKEIIDSREDKNDEQEFLQEAYDEFDAAREYEKEYRDDGEDDLSMIKGGKGQWPGSLLAERDLEKRPVIVNNQLPSFVKQVVNAARQNKMSINAVAMSKDNEEQAEKRKPSKWAENMTGLIRQIEAKSHAGQVRHHALRCAANNGFGFYKLVTEYTNDRSFYQEARLRRVKNPFTIYMDPKHQDPVGRDCRFIFEADMIDRKEYPILFPGKEAVDWEKLERDSSNVWADENNVRVAKYWVKRPYDMPIVQVSDGRVFEKVKWDKIADDLKAAEREDPNTGEILNPAPVVVDDRTVKTHIVAWYLIDGQKIIDGPKKNGKFILDFNDDSDIRDEDGAWRAYVWPTQFIPIIPVWGDEMFIKEQHYVKGVVRDAKDAQRMDNYWFTKLVEQVALDDMAPIFATPKQIAGFEEIWESEQPRRYYPYNYDDEAPGPPQRQQAAQIAPGHLAIIQFSRENLMRTTNIFESGLGMPSNETSGKAVALRQGKGELANSAYEANLAESMAYEGEQHIALIQATYDTEREITILNADNKPEFVTINETIIDRDTGQEVTLNDMTQGLYSVTVTVGPAFTTQRMEYAQALVDIIRSVPDPVLSTMMLMRYFRNADWPGADDTADMLEEHLEQIKIRQTQGPSEQEQADLGKTVAVTDKVRVETMQKVKELQGEVE